MASTEDHGGRPGRGRGGAPAAGGRGAGFDDGHLLRQDWHADTEPLSVQRLWLGGGFHDFADLARQACLTEDNPELVPYLAFVLFRIPLPLTIIQILAVDLGTDMLPALALGAEKPDPGVMQRPPRARSERLLSWGLLARAYLFLGVLEAAAAMAVFFFVLEAAGWHYGVSLDRTDPLYLQATSACLATIVVMQMMNVVLCRHPFKSSFSLGLFGNRYILMGLAAELGVILLIIYTAAGNWLFGTAPIGAAVWLLALVGATLMWVFEELRKAWRRRTLAREVDS